MTNTTFLDEEALPEWCYDFAVNFKENCPDCDSLAGEPHNEGCDIERCSQCFRQRVICECLDHNPIHAVWTGSWPLKKNVELSKQLRSNGKVEIETSYCYNNSFSLLMQGVVANATYVEGYVLFRERWGTPHGWLEVDDQIVDATLPWQGRQYLPVLRFKGQQHLSKGLQIPRNGGRTELPIYERFRWGNSLPGFVAATEATKRHMNLPRESRS